MRQINILYVDDGLDKYLSKYLDEYFYTDSKVDVVFTEKKFVSDSTYEELISSSEVKNANIIVIDSALFENNNVHKGKFTGEEFKIILKKYFPFIEVIVVTQNNCHDGMNIVKKYSSNGEETYQEYYTKNLKEQIDAGIKNIMIYRNLAENLMKNVDVDIVLKEKIANSIKGINVYDELTKSDIDNFIKTFKMIKD